LEAVGVIRYNAKTKRVELAPSRFTFQYGASCHKPGRGRHNTNAAPLLPTPSVTLRKVFSDNGAQFNHATMPRSEHEP